MNPTIENLKTAIEEAGYHKRKIRLHRRLLHEAMDKATNYERCLRELGIDLKIQPKGEGGDNHGPKGTTS